MKCKMRTWDITNKKGKCDEDCKYGAWHNGYDGESCCGAECIECGGTLYYSEEDAIMCDDCGCKF